MKISQDPGFRALIITAIIIGGVVVSSLSGCDDIKKSEEEDARSSDIQKQIDRNGYAEVGAAPDGQRLYMKEVDLGWTQDRVYFFGSPNTSITAREYCGKNCSKSVTTAR